MYSSIETLAAGMGTPAFLGVVTATTTTNNHGTAVPFNDGTLTNKVLLLQPDTACYILPGITNAATVTTANGVYLGANERVIMRMNGDMGWVACVAVAGTTNLRIWELT